MPGLRHAGFRSGNLNEELGLHLLRWLAFVAPVPRTEDVGLDAVATLAMPHRQRPIILVAGQSFYVQIKTLPKASTVVTYCGDEVEWFRALQLPFFVGITDASKSSLALYTAHEAQFAAACYKFDSLTLKMGHDVRAQCEENGIDIKRSSNGKSATVWLGDPVLKYSLVSVE